MQPTVVETGSGTVYEPVVRNTTEHTASFDPKAQAVDFIKTHLKNPSDGKKKKDYSDINQVIWDNAAGFYDGKGKVMSNDNLTKLSSLLGVDHDNNSKSGNLYKKLKKLGIKGFAHGSKYIDKDQLALTQEEGQEIIASDGSILTPLNKGDMVFSNESTKRLFEFGQDPQAFIKKYNLSPEVITNIIPQFDIPKPTLPEYTPINKQMQNNVSVNIGDINMHGVNDKEEFSKTLISVLKDSTRVQRVFGTFVNNEVMGKGSLDIRRF